MRLGCQAANKRAPSVGPISEARDPDDGSTMPRVDRHVDRRRRRIPSRKKGRRVGQLCRGEFLCCVVKLYRST